MLLPTRHQIIHIPRIQQVGPRLLHIRDARQPHTRLQLVLQYLTQVLHALPPIAQAVQERPPDAHGRRPERERLEDVRAPRDAAVDVDLAPVEDVRADAVELQEGEEGRLRRVEGAAAVVRQHEARDAVVAERRLRVRGALDALDDDGQAGRLVDPGDVGPGERLVDILAREPAEAAAPLVGGGHGDAEGGGDGRVGGDALVRFALAGDVGVDGDEDGFDAELAGFVQELGRFGAVGVDVELEEEGLVGAAGFDDGGEGVGGVV